MSTNRYIVGPKGVSESRFHRPRPRWTIKFISFLIVLLWPLPYIGLARYPIDSSNNLNLRAKPKLESPSRPIITPADVRAEAPPKPKLNQPLFVTHTPTTATAIAIATTTAKTITKTKTTSTTHSNWSPCDAVARYEEICRPTAPSCVEEHLDNPSTHGIGNALMISYSRMASESFSRGCVPRFNEPATYGVEQVFKLQKWMQEPTTIPTEMSQKGCVTWPLTQPGPMLEEVVQSGRGDGRTPTVGLHVRTGWVDSITERNGKRDLWDSLTCEETSLNDAGQMVRDAKDVPLVTLLEDAVTKADSTFGVNAWDLFVSSDAPGVKIWVAARLRERVRSVRHLNGEVGHNWVKGEISRDDVSLSALAELVLLSEADLLFHFGSKYPTSAFQRTLCQKEHVEFSGMPRHHLADMTAALRSNEQNVSHISRNINVVHPCHSVGASTVLACACMFKQSYSGQ